ncbi:aminotransferase [Melampsora americana]|nr:aminotransferase [Melampsora americana]
MNSAQHSSSSSSPISFELLTTILYDPNHHPTIPLLERHLNRLKTAHQSLAIQLPHSWCATDEPCDPHLIQNKLSIIAQGPIPLRLRVTVGPKNQVTIIPSAFITQSRHSQLPIVVIDDQPTHYKTPFLLFKTTQRDLYDSIRSRHHLGLTNDGKEPFDVLMYNSDGQLTESTIANVACKRSGTQTWITPATSCGLLPGVKREEMLEKGEIQEGIILISELTLGSWDVICFNALRGVYPVQLQLESLISS